jgi:hypothetical protein
MLLNAKFIFCSPHSSSRLLRSEYYRVISLKKLPVDADDFTVSTGSDHLEPLLQSAEEVSRISNSRSKKNPNHLCCHWGTSTSWAVQTCCRVASDKLSYIDSRTWRYYGSTPSYPGHRKILQYTNLACCVMIPMKLPSNSYYSWHFHSTAANIPDGHFCWISRNHPLAKGA